MPQNIEISVMVPVYNGQDYLDTCLQSLLNQSLKHFEIVIIDDHSTDRTVNIIEHYTKKDSRIKVIRHPENKGLPASLNSGISLAKGEFQTWISHDNYIGPEYLELMLKEIRDTRADIVFSDYWEVDSSGTILGQRLTENAFFLACGNVIGASFIYRNVVAEKLGGYNVNYFSFEDYDFWIRAYQDKFTFSRCSIKPYFYRLHSNQLTNTMRLPDIFFQYKYSLLKKIPVIDSLLFARATISLLKLSWKYYKLHLVIKVFLGFVVPHPFSIFKYVGNKILDK